MHRYVACSPGVSNSNSFEDHILTKNAKNGITSVPVCIVGGAVAGNNKLKKMQNLEFYS